MSQIDNKIANTASIATTTSWLSSASIALPSFITVPVLAIAGPRPLEFTLYHKQANGQVVPLCKAGEPLADADRARFLPNDDKPAEPLYVAAAEYDIYHRRAETALNSLLTDGTLGPTRFQVAYQVCVQLVDELLDHGKGDLVQRAQAAVDQLVAAAQMQPHLIASVLASRSWVYESPSHMVNVALLTLAVASETGLPASDWSPLVTGAMLHDIGKIGLPESLTSKEGRLTQSEWMLIREHPGRGSEWLKQFGCLNPLLADVAMQHHELADGSGYPQGLAGAAIHPWACLYSTLDMLDSLTGARPFREGLALQDALAVIQSETPARFDPASVETLAKLIGSGTVAAPADQLHAGGSVVIASVGKKMLPLESFLPLPPAAPAEGPLEACSSLPQRSHNRRSFVRHPFKTICRVRYLRPGAAPDAHISFWVQTLDISRGGLQFMFNGPMRLGEIISLFLPTGQAGRHVNAMVARCQRAPDNVFLIGVRFDYDK